MNERKSAGASYIINFYQSVQLLNHEYCLYQNFLIEIENKFGANFDEKKVDEDIYTKLLEQIQRLRYICHKSNLEYRSIAAVANMSISPAYSDAYAHIKTAGVIFRDKIEIYVIEMNKVLLSEIITDLLANSQELLNTLYAQPTTSKDNRPESG